MMQSAYRINVSRPGMADLQDDLNQSILPQNVNGYSRPQGTNCVRTADWCKKKYREARVCVCVCVCVGGGGDWLILKMN